ncbi:hypothetical protein [Thalassotalea eurytherma]|uniref:Sulfotransferase family protein n=1 Tax=Thalassotalea eurytherma TaxID=1144278 RepID=A0ABQ6H1B6_9GAMM|nr:hypothetical protein [Thalassotalea eurytherma]GLX81279.1 hypothetical protein theurythT_07310 [Thalassotalea eurytherma]
MTITLHVGMGKCGSSALQRFLSTNSKIETSKNKKLLYVVITKDLKLFYGTRLSWFYRLSRRDYLASAEFRFWEKNGTKTKKLLERIKVLSKHYHIVLSNEGWISDPDKDYAVSLFDELNLKVNLLMYVRPPCTWLNSAWWQWGAWTGAPFDKWLKQNTKRVQYASLIESWKNNDCIREVNIRALPANIIDDFCEIFQVTKHSVKSVEAQLNSSLPNAVLRLFQRNRQLRPSAHQASVDFTLMRLLTLQGKPDWVLSRGNIETILNETKRSNRALLKMVNDDVRASIEQDDRWWQTDAYHKLNYQCPDYPNLDPIELELLTVKLIQQLAMLEQQNKRYKRLLWPLHVVKQVLKR